MASASQILRVSRNISEIANYIANLEPTIDWRCHKTGSTNHGKGPFADIDLPSSIGFDCRCRRHKLNRVRRYQRTRRTICAGCGEPLIYQVGLPS
jgi:hypothetical protein